eukprot:10148099-Lingulodinium_polyedra.AAC.1
MSRRASWFMPRASRLKPRRVSPRDAAPRRATARRLRCCCTAARRSRVGMSEASRAVGSVVAR